MQILCQNEGQINYIGQFILKTLFYPKRIQIGPNNLPIAWNPKNIIKIFWYRIIIVYRRIFPENFMRKYVLKLKLSTAEVQK